MSIFPIFPSEDSEYIVEQKDTRDIGVRKAMYPDPPLDNCELVSVAISGNSVYLWWRRKMSLIDRFFGKRFGEK